MNSPVVYKISLRAESLATQITVEGSLSRMFPHVNLEVVIFDKTLTTLLTQVSLARLDPHVTVQSVRLELTVGDKTPSTQLTHKWLLASVDPDVALHLSSGSERLVADSAGVRLHSQVDLDVIPLRGWILERLATLVTIVCFLVTQLKVRCPHVSLEIARMVELFITMITVVPVYFEILVMCLHVTTQNTFGHVTLATDLAFVLQLFGV